MDRFLKILLLITVIVEVPASPGSVTQLIYTDTACTTLAGASVAGALIPLVADLGSCTLYLLIETGGPVPSRTYIKFAGCSSASPHNADFQLFSDAGCVSALPNASGSAPSGSCLSGSRVNGTNSMKFFCSSAPPPSIPQTGVSVTITAYDDITCNVRSRNFSGALNPLATTWNNCTAGPTIEGQQHFVQASSCGVNASVAVYYESSCTQFKFLLVQGNAICDSADAPPGAAALKFVCTTFTPPPTPSPSPPLPSVVANALCNNGQGCIASGDALAQCFGRNVSGLPQYVCRCSSLFFIPPNCVSVAAQQLLVDSSAQQFSDAANREAYLQMASTCNHGQSLCPPTPEPSAAQQVSQLQSLNQTRNSLQMQLTRILSQFQLQCNASCPVVCPLSCSPMSPALCPSGCPLVGCFSCASQLDLLRSVNASLIQVNIDYIRIQNQPPPSPGSIFNPSKADQCVASIVQCFNTSSASSLSNAIQSQASFCSDSGSKYCPLLGCVSNTTSCIPLDQCPAATPKRCPFLGTIDGGSPCFPANVSCPTTGVIQAVCPLNQTLCPGGLQCAPGSGTSFFQVNLLLQRNAQLLPISLRRLACSAPVDSTRASPQHGTAALMVSSLHKPRVLVCVRLIARETSHTMQLTPLRSDRVYGPPFRLHSP